MNDPSRVTNIPIDFILASGYLEGGSCNNHSSSSSRKYFIIYIGNSTILLRGHIIIRGRRLANTCFGAPARTMVSPANRHFLSPEVAAMIPTFWRQSIDPMDVVWSWSEKISADEFGMSVGVIRSPTSAPLQIAPENCIS